MNICLQIRHLNISSLSKINHLIAHFRKFLIDLFNAHFKNHIEIIFTYLHFYFMLISFELLIVLCHLFDFNDFIFVQLVFLINQNVFVSALFVYLSDMIMLILKKSIFYVFFVPLLTITFDLELVRRVHWEYMVL